MIQEEETFKKFGYRPSEVSRSSNKPILAKCDGCGCIRITSKHIYRCLCNSCKQKGAKNHMFGNTPSDEIKEKMRIIQTGEKNPIFGKHRSDTVKKKISDTRKKRIKEGTINPIKWRRTKNTKTRPEKAFEEICKKHTLPFKYTGDGDFWIHNINPDFIDCNGKKIAVEIFSYWHNQLRRFGKIRYLQTYEGRKKTLKEYGWKLVVFWQEDLERKNAEQFVLKMLNKEGINVSQS